MEQGTPKQPAEDTLVVPLVAVWAPLSTSDDVPRGGQRDPWPIMGEGDTPSGLARLGVAVTQPNPTHHLDHIDLYFDDAIQ